MEIGEGVERDPFVNVINSGVKRDIEVLLQRGSYRGAVILTMLGLELMGFLDRTHERPREKEDFIAWVTRYLKFGDEPEVPTGEEWWSLRNGFVHMYRLESSKHAQHGLRTIMFGNGQVFIYSKEKRAFLISVLVLTAAFFEGIEAFYKDLDRDDARRLRVEERLRTCVHVFKAADGAPA